MKHVIIGDLHGRDIWKQVDFSRYEKAVFLGDYVDSFKRTDKVILENLEAIIDLKKRNPQKIVLLWGTHEYPYLHFPKYKCPGFRVSMQPRLTHLFNTNRHLFQMAYQRRNIIFTHAGITNTWFRRFRDSVAAYKVRTLKSSLADLLNAVELSGYEDILYTPSPFRTGEDDDGSPLWADYLETFQDALNGYHQFVGHTAQDEPRQLRWHGKSITYLDVLHKQAYFHELHC